MLRGAPVLLVLLALLVTGCDGGSSPAAASSTTTSNHNQSKTEAEALPPAAGPFARLRWPAGAVKAGVLIHDDGQRLWNVPLRGPAKVIWTHRKARVYEIAAAPGGKSLAYVVEMTPANPTARDVMAYLYLLRPDGKIQLIDQVKNFRSLESPVFLGSPVTTSASGPPLPPGVPAPRPKLHLFWYRGSQDLKRGTAHLDNRVMVLDRNRLRQVKLGLRPNEAVADVSGYAGAANLSIITFRHDDLPTRGEVLRLEGAPSLTNWREFGSAANTDQLGGVAWVSPYDYVVPVTQRNSRKDDGLRLFHVGCEYYGSHLVYRGLAIDKGYAEQPWSILPAGLDRALVLGAADMRKLADKRVTSVPWLAVNLKSGAFQQTDARFDNKGWWAFVQPASSKTDPQSCGSFAHAFPLDFPH